MKNLAIIALLAVGVCATQAEDKKPEPKKDDAPKRGGGIRGGGDLLKDLNLTADQQAKYDAFNKEQREKMSGFKDLSQEQRAAKFQEFNKTRQAFMEKLLTAEQSAKFKEIMAKRGPRPGGPGGPGKAPEKK